jgi:hypothetical protein
MLKRVSFNFFKFNEQLVEEIRSEEDFYNALISSDQLTQTQK